VTLTPHPLLVPWSRKSRAIPLLPLWAVRPVQSLSACAMVHFTFYFGNKTADVAEFIYLLTYFNATRYGLDGPGIGSRWGGIFSAPVQTARGAHPAI